MSKPPSLVETRKVVVDNDAIAKIDTMKKEFIDFVKTYEDRNDTAVSLSVESMTTAAALARKAVSARERSPAPAEKHHRVVAPSGPPPST